MGRLCRAHATGKTFRQYLNLAVFLDVMQYRLVGGEVAGESAI
jgi:hypothetical protein